MRPVVATVLSAREWEPVLAAVARHSGRVRLVGRVFEPIELERMPRPDWIVVGAETAWLGGDWVEAMHDAGSSVVGVYGDDGEAGHLEEIGVDVLAPADGEPTALLRRLLLPSTREPMPGTPVVGVLGAPGAGTTTVAIAFAADDPGTALVDTDPIPGVGPTLGMPPPPRSPVGPTDAPGARHGVDGPFVVTAGGEADVGGVVAACRRRFDRVVVDACPGFHDRLGWCATEVVLVVDASVQGMLRAIAMVERWDLPEPALVLNRVTDLPGAVEAARRSLGLDPVACVPLSLDPGAAALAALADQASGRRATG